MTKKLAIAAALLALPLGVAHAGSKAGPTASIVTINVQGRWAQGALGQVRNSTDTVEYIGCATVADTTGATSGICSARDPLNNYVSCYVQSTAAAMITELQSLSGDAFVFFSYDANGYCTTIQVTNNSTLALKAP